MTLAAAGTYAVAGTSTNCPAGKYSARVGATQASDCLPCPAGYFCTEPTTDYTANVCTAGYFCPEGSTAGNTNACPAGTYSTTTGLKSASECTVCPVGYYCIADAVTGIIAPVACAAGTYSGRIKLVAATDGASRGCIACPAGYKCPNSPQYEPEACPVGKYSAASATACIDCPVGKYCDKEATTDSGYTTIEDGFYYTGGAGLAVRPYHTSSTYSCPPGYWCAGNAKTACLAGQYQPLYG